MIMIIMCHCIITTMIIKLGIYYDRTVAHCSGGQQMGDLPSIGIHKVHRHPG